MKNVRGTITLNKMVKLLRARNCDDRKLEDACREGLYRLEPVRMAPATKKRKRRELLEKYISGTNWNARLYTRHLESILEDEN